LPGSPLRVLAELDVCIGAGVCVLTAPKVFDQGEDDGLVRLLVAPVPDEYTAAVRDAVDLCPSGALSLEDDAT
jgi:ferredoxin